jgi:hypothetical protein
MPSRRARELQSLSSRTASPHPVPGGGAPTATRDGRGDASPSPLPRPLPAPDAARVRRGGAVAVVLGVAALAVVATAVVAGLPLLPAAVAAGVLLTAARAVPLAVHLAHLRQVRGRDEPAVVAGRLGGGGPAPGTAA